MRRPPPLNDGGAMRILLTVTLTVPILALTSSVVLAQGGPAEGYTIHVTAPHVVDGTEVGPIHHFCKVISPEPVIQCLMFESMDANAKLTGIEYIVAKKLTRTTAISLDDWNENWHDHTVEIAGGRVKVHDLPPDEAKEVADLIATTDGLIFHLWPMAERFPNSRPQIAQAVGHRPITAKEKFMNAPAVAPGNK
jgi:hypothetical protein